MLYTAYFKCLEKAAGNPEKNYVLILDDIRYSLCGLFETIHEADWFNRLLCPRFLS